jgi:GNAT superfamily N-acetyltransferase
MKLINSREFIYKFLRHDVELALRGESIFYDDSILNIQGESWILIIHAEKLLVYGCNWLTSQLEEIKRSFDLTQFSNYLITGDSKLIKALLEFYNIENYETEMERLFYRASSISTLGNEAVNISLANENDVAPVAVMLQQYYHEEYNGENDKKIEEMVLRVEACISDEAMTVLRSKDGKLLSFCTIINPDIGILFTNLEYRGKGYGKILLSYWSKMLLEHNSEVYLMTVKTRIESNAVCQKVGYVPFFDYSYVRVNKTGKV